MDYFRIPMDQGPQDLWSGQRLLGFSGASGSNKPMSLQGNPNPGADVNLKWETDFYTPPVLGSAALFDNSAPAVYKNPVP